MNKKFQRGETQPKSQRNYQDEFLEGLSDTAKRYYRRLLARGGWISTACVEDFRRYAALVDEVLEETDA